MVEIVTKLDSSYFGEFADDDFEEFGLKTSHTYRATLLEARARAGLSEKEFLVVVMLATAIKSKKRILEAMTKFNTRAWYPAVRKFFEDRTVQYTSEITENRVAVVHIPSCVPNLAAVCWIAMRSEKTITLESFVNNLWFPQLRVDNNLKLRQKAWETSFWNTAVKKGSAAFEKQGFNEGYWATKANDSYPLISYSASGSLIMIETPLTEEGFNEYIDHCTKWVNISKRNHRSERDGKKPEASMGADAGASSTAGRKPAATKPVTVDKP